MKKLLYTLLLFPLCVIGQDGTQNYVKTSTYIDEIPYPLPVEYEDQVNKQDQVTYLDGLGRPIQQISGKASGDEKDIITHITYDLLGRQDKEYLPYKSANANLAFDPAAALNQKLFYLTEEYDYSSAYSQKKYEASPLARIRKQAAPGDAWLPASSINNENDHTIKYSYGVNTENEVKFFSVYFTTSNTEIASLSLNGHYAKNELFKNIVKDENWISTDGLNKTTEEFKDQQGRIILKRYYNNGAHDTYYVYDKYNNLTYVIPPLAAVALHSTTTHTVWANTLNQLCYIYHFDHRNRQVEKKIPGKQWEYIVYDGRDRIVATGPVINPFGGSTEGWMYTYYEDLDRPAFTGWYVSTTFNTTARLGLQTGLYHTGDVLNVGRGGTNYINSIPLGYKPPATLQTNFQLLTVNYYDTYGYPGFVAFTAPGTLPEPKGMPTGTWNRILSQPSDVHGTLSYQGYDAKGRVVEIHNSNGYFATQDIIRNYMDWRGVVYSTGTTHKRTGFPDLLIYDGFEYDHSNRLLKHRQANKPFSGWDMAQSWHEIVRNTYDDLGQLEVKNVGGHKTTAITGDPLPLQTVDYAYNIRGWLKKINNPDHNLTLGNDLFAFEMNYNAPDLGVNSTALYNGNISETHWRSRNPVADVKRSYSYKYDHLNRLTEANYYNTSTTAENGRYTEKILSYDLNGNILNLDRWGLTGTGTYGKIDQLTYVYSALSATSNPNHLLRVTEASDQVAGFNNGPTASANDYTYDTNGNMVQDLNKGIGALGPQGIVYNHLNLPTRVNFASGTQFIDYLYDAAGTKLSKKVTSSASANTTTQYASVFVYEASQATSNKLMFYSHPEGYVKVGAPTTVNSVLGYNTFNYFYQYMDHLGNTRLTYSDNDNNGILNDTEKFQDGFETQSGWGNYTFSWPLTAYDGVTKRTGNYSGRIDNPSATENYVNSNYWMPINNSVATNYTFTMYVRGDGSNAQAEIFLLMKTATEQGYTTSAVSQPGTATSTGWTPITRTYLVPANIKFLNIRLDNNGGGTIWYDDVELRRTTPGATEIIQEDNYYAFGLQHKGYGAPVNAAGVAAAQKYRYNGMELQDELNLNWYDYQARNYDPALGRWMNIDPLAEKSRRFSPYVYALNNPVYFIDPDGMEADASAVDSDDWKKTADGNYVHDPNLTKDNASQQLKAGEEYVGKEGTLSTGTDTTGDGNIDNTSMQFGLHNDGSVTNLDTGNNLAPGETVSLDSGSTITASGESQINQASLPPIVALATLAIEGITVDAAIPEPTDAVPAKWVAYAVIAAVSAAIIYSHSDEINNAINTGVTTTIGHYDSMSKSKKGKASQRQEEVQHGNQGNGKLTGAKKTAHQKRRPGDMGDKKRGGKGWKQH